MVIFGMLCLKLNVAHAFIFHDPVHTGANVAAQGATAATVAGGTSAHIASDWSRDALKFVKQVLTEFLKRQILDRIVAMTVQWIQGGGKPQFIQNWDKFMTDAASNAIGNTLFSIKETSFLCSPIYFRVMQNLFSQPGLGRGPIYCTFNQVVGNIDWFIMNFQNGGWYGWNTLWNDPSNNVFGTYLIAWNAANQQAEKAKEATKHEGLSSGGFLAIKECVEKIPTSYTEHPGIWICSADDTPSGDKGACEAWCTPKGGLCVEQTTEMLNPTAGKCAKYENRTPGQVVGSLAAKAVGSDIDYIVNAQDLAAYVAAIVDAALSRVIKESLALMRPSASSPPPPSSATSFIDQSIFTSTTPPRGAGYQPGSEALSQACQGLTGAQYNQCVQSAASAFSGTGFEAPSTTLQSNTTCSSNQVWCSKYQACYAAIAAPPDCNSQCTSGQVFCPIFNACYDLRVTPEDCFECASGKVWCQKYQACYDITLIPSDCNESTTTSATTTGAGVCNTDEVPCRDSTGNLVTCWKPGTGSPPSGCMLTGY